MKNSIAATVGFLVLAFFSWGSQADAVKGIEYLQTRWAEIKYQMPDSEQEKAFGLLVAEAKKMREAHPAEAPFLIWEGIIRSTYAGAKGGLGALDQVKQAKKLFEQAIALAPESMMGSAYTSLGSLYYQVPGWPVGFGDEEKAKAMLLKGLSYNPDGIDPNYFYADFLLDQKQYRQALSAFEKALLAPARPGRQLADEGRKHEIEAGINQAKKHL
jgi:tetratricopeptide (TPR) repeat protein